MLISSVPHATGAYCFIIHVITWLVFPQRKFSFYGSESLGWCWDSCVSTWFFSLPLKFDFSKIHLTIYLDIHTPTTPKTWVLTSSRSRIDDRSKLRVRVPPIFLGSPSFCLRHTLPLLMSLPFQGIHFRRVFARCQIGRNYTAHPLSPRSPWLMAGVRWNAILLGLYPPQKYACPERNKSSCFWSEGVKLPSASNENLLHRSVRFTILYLSRVSVG